jgi:hypothetical protein
VAIHAVGLRASDVSLHDDDMYLVELKVNSTRGNSIILKVQRVHEIDINLCVGPRSNSRGVLYVRLLGMSSGPLVEGEFKLILYLYPATKRLTFMRDGVQVEFYQALGVTATTTAVPDRVVPFGYWNPFANVRAIYSEYTRAEMSHWVASSRALMGASEA